MVRQPGVISESTNLATLNLYPRFAVCLTAYNGMLWLTEQLNSILEQVNVSLSVFISVDRSTDGTEAWFEDLANNDSRIVLLPHGFRFGGAAGNFFRILRDVEFSNFDYVCFADQDDIWFSDKLLRAHEILTSTGADAYSSNVVAFWPNGYSALIKKAQPQVQWDFLFESAGPGCTYVMKTKLVNAIQNLIKTSYGQVQHIGQGQHDWFIYAFARANGYQWVIDDYAGMLYRQHERNQVGVNIGWRAFVYRVREVLNGWALTQSVLISELVGLNKDPFVTRWSGGSRGGILWLALRARQCRRRRRDQILFAIACVILSVLGRRNRHA